MTLVAADSRTYSTEPVGLCGAWFDQEWPSDHLFSVVAAFFRSLWPFSKPYGLPTVSK